VEPLNGDFTVWQNIHICNVQFALHIVELFPFITVEWLQKLKVKNMVMSSKHELFQED